MPRVGIGIDDPRLVDVRALIEQHRTFNYEHTPPADVHALDLAGLISPAVTFFSARLHGEVVAIGALQELDETQAELKCMHTAEAVRGQGLGQAMVDHVVGVARQRRYRRVSLETGAMDAYEPARSLYRRAGFTVCGPFGNYSASPNSTFMTLVLH